MRRQGFPQLGAALPSPSLGTAGLATEIIIKIIEKLPEKIEIRNFKNEIKSDLDVIQNTSQPLKIGLIFQIA